MLRQIKECNPTILDQDTLMSGDGLFIDLETYKASCSKDCSHKKECGLIINLLDAGKYEQAIKILWK